MFKSFCLHFFNPLFGILGYYFFGSAGVVIIGIYQVQNTPGEYGLKTW
jgi:hypothetical protein